MSSQKDSLVQTLSVTSPNSAAGRFVSYQPSQLTIWGLGPHLLTWFHLNTGMDK